MEMRGPPAVAGGLLFWGDAGRAAERSGRGRDGLLLWAGDSGDGRRFHVNAIAAFDATHLLTALQSSESAGRREAPASSVRCADGRSEAGGAIVVNAGNDEQPRTPDHAGAKRAVMWLAQRINPEAGYNEQALFSAVVAAAAGTTHDESSGHPRRHLLMRANVEACSESENASSRA